MKPLQAIAALAAAVPALLCLACSDQAADSRPPSAGPAETAPPAPAPVAPLAAAPRPLPALLPPERAVPDLPPPIPLAELTVDLGGGRSLRPAELAPSISLDGTWRCSGLTTAAQPFADDAQLDRGWQDPAFDDAAWAPIAVPLDWYRAYPKARDKAAPWVIGWYRRDLELGAEANGKRAVLRFGVIGYEADLWVNGKPAGSHHGDFTPWTVDVGDLVHQGRNLVALRVRSDMGPSFGGGPLARHAYGSQWSISNIKGGMWQSCSLSLEPAARIAEVLVSPRWEQRSLRLDWRIVAAAGSPERVALRAIVQGARRGGEGDRPADLQLGEVVLKPGENSGIAEVPLADIKAWSPERPELYWLTLVAERGGEAVAARSERFGFRGMATRDGRFLLNGQPRYLFGENLAALGYGGNGESPDQYAAHIDRDLRGLKRNGYVIFRHAHMPVEPAVLWRADELGLMVYDEWCWSFTDKLDPVEFPKRDLEEVGEWVRRDHNHPAVVMWSCGNEVKYGDELVRTTLDRQVAAVRAADHAGRPVSTFSGAAYGYGNKALDSDLLDLHDYLGLSSASPWTRWEDQARTISAFLERTYGAGWRMRKPFIVWESVGFSWGQKSDPAFKAGDPDAYLRWARKPTSWGDPEGVGFAGTIGMAAALDPARGNRLGRQVYGRRIGEFIRRDPTAAGFAPWFQDPQLAEARQWTQPVFACLYGPNRIALRHPFAGRSYPQTALVANDGDAPLNGAVLTASLAGADGAERTIASLPVPDLAPTERRELPLTLVLPPAETAGWWQLRLRVVAGGRELSCLSYDLFAAPAGAAREPLGPARSVAVLAGGDDAAVRRWLGDLGVAVRAASSPGDLAGAAVAIVPPGRALSSDEGSSLRSWVRGGGDLVVLEQGPGEVAALRRSAAPAGNTFVDLVVPGHPLFTGLGQEAFDTSDLPDHGLWIRHGLSPLGADVLAARGPFLGTAGVSAAVAEGALGKGRILASQVLALGQWDVDSVATTYLRNLAAYVLRNGAARAPGLRPWEEAGTSLSVLPADCRPLDLRAVANRAFADATADDGQGGWTDQGANDFRMMPLGAQTVANVPMTIIDPAANAGRACLVLGGSGRPGPERAEGIAVGGPVSRLFFLHAAAWVGGQGAVSMTYRIRYADGTVAEVPVRTGIEIADWWGPGELPRARPALCCRNPEGQEVGLFLMPWENPRPEVAVEAIEVVASGKTVPIVVAITAERANPDPLRFTSAWTGLADRPGSGPDRKGPGVPVVAAGTAAAPGGGATVRIAFPGPAERGDDRTVPVAFTGLPAADRARVGDAGVRYLTLWIKAESHGTLDLVLPRQDWKDSLESQVTVDPADGWRKLRLALAADLRLGQGKAWTAKDLRGELFLYYGRNLPAVTAAPPALTVEIADPRLE